MEASTLHNGIRTAGLKAVVGAPASLPGGLLVSGGGISVRGGHTIHERLQKSLSLPRTADDNHGNRLLTQGFEKSASTNSRIVDSEFAFELPASDRALECQATNAYERSAASFRSNNQPQMLGDRLALLPPNKASAAPIRRPDDVDPQGIHMFESLDEPGTMVVRRTKQAKASQPDKLILGHRNLKECCILEGEEGLQLLNYEHNNISRIRNLQDLGDLVFLDMFSNCIERIAGLDSLAALKYLLLGRNYIRRVAGLEALHSLDVVDLHDNLLDSMEGLEQCTTTLRVLNLSGNRIGHMCSLSSLVNLSELNLKRNFISLLESNTHSRNANEDGGAFEDTCSSKQVFPSALRYLFLSHNRVASFSSLNALVSLTQLQELSLDGNPLGSCLPPKTYHKGVLQYCSQTITVLDGKLVSPDDHRYARRVGVPVGSHAQDTEDCWAGARPVCYAWPRDEQQNDVGTLRLHNTEACKVCPNTPDWDMAPPTSGLADSSCPEQCSKRTAGRIVGESAVCSEFMSPSTEECCTAPLEPLESSSHQDWTSCPHDTPFSTVACESGAAAADVKPWACRGPGAEGEHALPPTSFQNWMDRKEGREWQGTKNVAHGRTSGGSAPQHSMHGDKDDASQHALAAKDINAALTQLTWKGDEAAGAGNTESKGLPTVTGRKTGLQHTRTSASESRKSVDVADAKPATSPCHGMVELVEGQQLHLCGDVLYALRNSSTAHVQEICLRHVDWAQVVAAVPLLVGLSRLRKVVAEHNKIQFLSQLDALQPVTRLQNLHIDHNAVADMVLFRPYAACKLPQLLMLNGVAVTDDDRGRGKRMLSPIAEASCRQKPVCGVGSQPGDAKVQELAVHHYATEQLLAAVAAQGRLKRLDSMWEGVVREHIGTGMRQANEIMRNICAWQGDGSSQENAEVETEQ